MKRRRVFIILFSICLICFSPVHAGYKMGEEKPLKLNNSSTTSKTKKFVFPPPGKSVRENPEEAAISALSGQFSIPTDRLNYFRSLHHGYEEIVPALIVAREAQVEVGRVLQLRMKNQTWKTIAETFDIQLEPLNEEVLSVVAPLRKRLPKKAMTERPMTRE